MQPVVLPQSVKSKITLIKLFEVMICLCNSVQSFFGGAVKLKIYEFGLAFRLSKLIAT